MRDENALRTLRQKGQLEPYIRYIRFPYFKNVEQNLKVEFEFPITALVGANGTSKSSILRAVQGCPEGYSIGSYWFSTDVDPITETGGFRSCFIYGYMHPRAVRVVEVIKTRVMDKRDNDPDYWEPSRPIISYGMSRLTLSDSSLSSHKTRWELVDKKVIYIDFRQSLSAFDQYFYHTNPSQNPADLNLKKSFVRKRSPYLKDAIAQRTNTYQWHKERIVDEENLVLNEKQLQAVCFILGRNYEEIIWIYHRFFNCEAHSAFMKSGDLTYTEAFAGSGEFAVVRLVMEITRAPEKSLILLDEPEVSLHPGAQERLMQFLAEAVKVQKQQIVISTHSPSIIRTLPPDAIKSFVLDRASGKIRLPSQSSSPEEAFFYIGEPLPGRITVVVEDALASAIIMKALRKGGQAFVAIFDVKFFPGGSKTLWAHYVPIFAMDQRDDVVIYFDGDERPATPFINPDDVPEANQSEIVADLSRVTGTTIKLHVDGNMGKKDEAQEAKLMRQLVHWAIKNVKYLPTNVSPEHFVWDNMEKDELSKKFDLIEDRKERFRLLARLELGRADFEDVSAPEILATQLRRLAKISDDAADVASLYTELLEFVKS